MRTATIRVTEELLHQATTDERAFLMIPDEWEIIGRTSEFPTDSVRFTVRGETVPEGYRGEIQGLYTKHEDGSITVEWKGIEPPGPPASMRRTYTDPVKQKALR